MPFCRLILASGLILLLAGCSVFSPRPPDKSIRYTVRKGDTVYAIAQRFGSTIDAILSFNDIDDPKRLRIGAVLVVPTDLIQRGGIPRGGLQQARSTAPEGESMKTVHLSGALRYVGKLAWPLESGGGQLRSLFGKRWGTFHEGIDIAAPTGTSIRAAHAGEVVYSSSKLSSYGNMVVVRTNDLMSIYAHNSKNLVSVGNRVKQGDIIAEVGATGHATGPHVHYETRIKDSAGKNVAVDPLVFYHKTK